MNAWLQGFFEGIEPEKELTVSQWADEYRMLSSKASSEPGRFRTSRTPYLKEPMDCLSTSSPIERVVMQFSAQSGKTECGNNWIGYIVHQAPSALLAVQPTVEMAKRLSKQRLASMLADTPVLAERIEPARSRDSGNTLFNKDFPGGMLLLTGANSATGLRSTPCRYIFADEIDAFPTDVEGEGDPVELACKRATTFARKKILLTSTPTLKDYSRIEKELLRSDFRKYYIPCPACGEFQDLKWDQLKWEKSDPSTVQYECISCKERFKELNKPQMLREGEWRATRESDGKTAGFHLNGLYSPLGWYSWESAVEEWLRCKDDAPALKTFINTRLAETWEQNYVSKLSAEGLMQRVEPYLPDIIPNNVKILTMGVDVQGGGGTAGQRLSYSVYGWADGEECWLISYGSIEGDPHQGQVWKSLTSLITNDWIREDKGKMKIQVTAIDSGGLATVPVYTYCREHQALGVIAIKGASTRNQAPISKGKFVDINFRGRAIKKGVGLFMVGTDTIKDCIMGRLKHNIVKEGSSSPGYLHFHAETEEEYFKEITSEQQILKTNKSGFTVPTWQKRAGARSERLDELVYAYSALNLLYQRYPRLKIWQIFSKLVQKDTINTQEKGLLSKKSVNSRNYVNSW